MFCGRFLTFDDENESIRNNDLAYLPISAVVSRMGIFNTSRAYDLWASNDSLSLEALAEAVSCEAGSGGVVPAFWPAPRGVLFALTSPAFTSDSNRFVIPLIVGTVLEVEVSGVLVTCACGTEMGFDAGGVCM